MTTRVIAKVPPVLPAAPDRLARLPLRAELFLLAHDDDTGCLHINEHTLEIGLAAAILLELHQAQWVAIGYERDFRTQHWLRRPGCLTLTRHGRSGDPLTDAALAAITYQQRIPPPEKLRSWLRHFRTSLYERVRAELLTVGVLHRTTRRRLGLLRTDTHLAVQPAWAVRIRGHIGDTVHAYHHPNDHHRYPTPDDQLVALCGLVGVLELTPFLYLPQLTPGLVNRWLDHVVSPKQREIREVIAAVDDGRGDLAVAALA